MQHHKDTVCWTACQLSLCLQQMLVDFVGCICVMDAKAFHIYSVTTSAGDGDSQTNTQMYHSLLLLLVLLTAAQQFASGCCTHSQC